MKNENVSNMIQSAIDQATFRRMQELEVQNFKWDKAPPLEALSGRRTPLWLWGGSTACCPLAASLWPRAMV